MQTRSDPRTLQALFEDVWIEVYLLETYVVLHRTLFRDREAAATLEATAPHTSRALGALVSDGIFLAVHRLVDVGARRGQRSASIETLLAHLPPDAAPLRRELKKTLTGLRAECRGVADVHHRLIAHRDYAVALEQEPAPERVDGRRILAAVAGFAQILTAISERCGFNLVYDPGEVHLDVEQLLARLRSEQR